MTRNPNLVLYDLDVRHQVGVSRLVASVSRKLVVHVDDATREVSGLIRDSDVYLSGGGVSKPRREGLVADIKTATYSTSDKVVSTIRSEMSDLSSYELDFQETSVSKASPSAELAHPSIASLERTLETSPVQGRLISEWGDDVAAAAFRRARDAIRQGTSDGDGIDLLVASVRGTRALNFKDGVAERFKRDVSGLARTALTFATVVAKTALFELNPDVFDREQWCSVLDDATTAVCRARDAQVYPLGEGPRPPAHWACRSTMLGLLKGQAPPPRETYSEWLGRQDREVQDEVLGVTEARLWRDGGVKLQRFVDRTGEEYKLDELRDRERAAFTKIGEG